MRDKLIGGRRGKLPHLILKYVQYNNMLVPL